MENAPGRESAPPSREQARDWPGVFPDLNHLPHGHDDLPDINFDSEFPDFHESLEQAGGEVMAREPLSGNREEQVTPMGTSGFHSGAPFEGVGSEVNSGTLGNDTGSSGKASSLKRRREKGRKEKTGQQTMTGRFCGRLPTKEDEKRLVEECKLIGQYLNDDPFSMNTMATIIRGIAAGTVREHLAKKALQEAEKQKRLEMLESRLEIIESLPNGHAGLVSLSETIVKLKDQLKTTQEENLELRWAVDGTMERTRSNHGALGAPGAAVQNSLAISAAPLGISNAGQPLGQAHSPLQADAGSMPQPILPRTLSAMTLAQSSHIDSPVNSLKDTGMAVDDGSGDPHVQGQAQQFVRAATLHCVAKEEAAYNAHALTAEARKHSVASIKAAAQAEELKKTISSMPDSERVSDQVQQAAATVESLEARAQAHASFTTQAVAKAKSMMEIAQNHEREQALAIATASALQSSGGIPLDSSISSPSNPSIVKNDMTSLVANATNTAMVADGPQKMSLNRSAVLPTGLPMPLLDQSHISYTNEMDPSVEALALQQQIAALHAQQPESLVSAPPIHISDADLVPDKEPGLLPLDDLFGR
jgi:hypothetical protein